MSLSRECSNKDEQNISLVNELKLSDKEVPLHLDTNDEHSNVSLTVANSGEAIAVWERRPVNGFSKIQGRKISPTGEPVDIDVALPIPGGKYMSDITSPKIVPHIFGFACAWLHYENYKYIKFGYFNLKFEMDPSQPSIDFVDIPKGQGKYSAWESLAIAKSKANYTAIAAFGHDSNLPNQGIYFRAFKEDGKPWVNAIKINENFTLNAEIDISSINENNFIICYTNTTRTSIFAKKVNYLGQDLSGSYPIISTANSTQLITPKIAVSENNRIIFSWLLYNASGVGHKIQYKTCNYDFEEPSNIKTIPVNADLSNHTVVAEDKESLFAICFSDLNIKQKIHLFKCDHKGNQTLIAPISTLDQSYKSSPSLIILQPKNYYCAWNAKNDNNSKGSVYGRNLKLFKPSEETAISKDKTSNNSNQKLNDFKIAAKL